MDCTSLVQEPNGKGVLSKFATDNVVERVDSEHLRGSMVQKTEGPPAIFTKSSFTDTWLSADCGDLNPQGGKK
jgi:hypothetical protein